MGYILVCYMFSMFNATISISDESDIARVQINAFSYVCICFMYICIYACMHVCIFWRVFAYKLQIVCYRFSYIKTKNQKLISEDAY